MNIPNIPVTESEKDLALWKQYKACPTPANRAALLTRMEGIIQKQVRKWAGSIPSEVLRTQAVQLVAKSFDTYNPDRGASLATHVTNSLLPLSRTVYTHQNVARIPENLIMKINTYNSTVNDFKLLNGRDPTTDELHDKLGWSASMITKMRDYNVRDLKESVGDVSGKFYDNADKWDDMDDTVLGGLYMSLTPDEKQLFEYTTGYNGARVLKEAEIAQKIGVSVAQVAYRKKLLRQKITQFMNRASIRRRYGS